MKIKYSYQKWPLICIVFFILMVFYFSVEVVKSPMETAVENISYFLIAFIFIPGPLLFVAAFLFRYYYISSKKLKRQVMFYGEERLNSHVKAATMDTFENSVYFTKGVIVASEKAVIEYINIDQAYCKENHTKAGYTYSLVVLLKDGYRCRLCTCRDRNIIYRYLTLCKNQNSNILIGNQAGVNQAHLANVKTFKGRGEELEYIDLNMAAFGEEIDRIDEPTGQTSQLQGHQYGVFQNYEVSYSGTLDTGGMQRTYVQNDRTSGVTRTNSGNVRTTGTQGTSIDEIHRIGEKNIYDNRYSTKKKLGFIVIGYALFNLSTLLLFMIYGLVNAGQMWIDNDSRYNSIATMIGLGFWLGLGTMLYLTGRKKKKRLLFHDNATSDRSVENIQEQIRLEQKRLREEKKEQSSIFFNQKSMQYGQNKNESDYIKTKSVNVQETGDPVPDIRKDRMFIIFTNVSIGDVSRALCAEKELLTKGHHFRMVALEDEKKRVCLEVITSLTPEISEYMFDTQNLMILLSPYEGNPFCLTASREWWNASFLSWFNREDTSEETVCGIYKGKSFLYNVPFMRFQRGKSELRSIEGYCRDEYRFNISQLEHISEDEWAECTP